MKPKKSNAIKCCLLLAIAGFVLYTSVDVATTTHNINNNDNNEWYWYSECWQRSESKRKRNSRMRTIILMITANQNADILTEKKKRR